MRDKNLNIPDSWIQTVAEEHEKEEKDKKIDHSIEKVKQFNDEVVSILKKLSGESGKSNTVDLVSYLLSYRCIPWILNNAV